MIFIRHVERKHVFDIYADMFTTANFGIFSKDLCCKMHSTLAETRGSTDKSV